MSEFRLSNLGYKFQKNITSMHPNVNKIRWEMLTYNLKEDTITGDLKIDIQYKDDDEGFNKLKAILLLSDMEVDTLKVKTTQDTSLDDPYFTQYTFWTSIALVDFPEVALGNYIKDAEETLSYEWYKQD